MAAILKTFAGLNFYTRTCFIDYYHISFKKSHQTLRPRSCRVNQNFDISWILDLGLYRVRALYLNALYLNVKISFPRLYLEHLSTNFLQTLYMSSYQEGVVWE